METTPTPPAAVESALPTAKRRASARLSIAGYLGLAFLAVLAVLVLGLRWAQQSARETAAMVTGVESRSGPILRIAAGLNDAITAFDQDLVALSRAAPAEGFERFRNSAQRLLTALYDYERLAASTPELPGSTLEERIVAYRTDGLGIGDLYHQRDMRARECLAAAESLANRSTRAAGGVESGEQVVARKTMADLARAAAALRESVTTAVLSTRTDQDAAAARDGGAFRTLLRGHAGELSRAPGQAWLELERDDLAITLRAFREARELDERIEAQRAAMATTARELKGLVETDLREPAVKMLTDVAARARATAQHSEQQFTRVAASVLGVILVIAISIIYGIVSPARRLLEATRHLSRGALDTRVPRGGVRELDELALSFNEMAHALDHTQGALQQQRAALEDRVAQRTAQLRYLANHDALTGLPNRRELATRLGGAIERARSARRCCAVLYVDIDNFKTINDSMGHEFGDRFLRGIGTRLGEVAGEGTFLARLGGDEFMLIIEGITSTASAEGRADRLLRAFQKPVQIDGRDLLTSFSIGVAVFPEHGDSAETLIRASDSALFHAKERGRNGFSVYRPELLAAASKRFHMEQGLRRALETGDFLLHYQPEVSLIDMKTTVVEALLRWRQDDGRIAPAAEFMAVAEQSGLILELSDWVLHQAIATARELRSRPWPQARIAINVSAEQFLTGRFVESVERALREANMPADCLEIELTETALQTGRVAVASLHALRRLGVTIALDDFGAGYSSLKSIDELPLTRVKLDRSLMQDIDLNGTASAIADSIVRLCRTLGLSVTAEGIEHPAQLDFLAGCGDVHAQGYLIARPAPLADVAQFAQDTASRLAAAWPGHAAARASAARFGHPSPVAILRPRGR